MWPTPRRSRPRTSSGRPRPRPRTSSVNCEVSFRTRPGRKHSDWPRTSARSPVNSARWARTAARIPRLRGWYGRPPTAPPGRRPSGEAWSGRSARRSPGLRPASPRGLPRRSRAGRVRGRPGGQRRRRRFVAGSRGLPRIRPGGRPRPVPGRLPRSGYLFDDARRHRPRGLRGPRRHLRPVAAAAHHAHTARGPRAAGLPAGVSRPVDRRARTHGPAGRRELIVAISSHERPRSRARRGRSPRSAIWSVRSARTSPSWYGTRSSRPRPRSSRNPRRQAKRSACWAEPGTPGTSPSCWAALR